VGLARNFPGNLLLGAALSLKVLIKFGLQEDYPPWQRKAAGPHRTWHCFAVTAMLSAGLADGLSSFVGGQPWQDPANRKTSDHGQVEKKPGYNKREFVRVLGWLGGQELCRGENRSGSSWVGEWGRAHAPRRVS